MTVQINFLLNELKLFKNRLHTYKKLENQFIKIFNYYIAYLQSQQQSDNEIFHKRFV